MTDVRQKLLSLPDLHLNPDEWTELNNILNSLEDKSINAIKDCLTQNKSLNINSHKISKLIAFLDAWITMSFSLKTWTSQLYKVWETLNNCALGADTLVPLMSELLPTEESQLKLMQNKLDLASQINFDSEVNYYLISLYIATTANITEFKEQKPSTDEKILIVAEEMRKLHQISLFIPICEDYINYLQKRFLTKLEALETVIYKQCVVFSCENTTAVDEKKLIAVVLEHLQLKNIEWNNAILDIEFEKYLILSDMYITITNENKSAGDRLSQFVKKFDHNFDFLMQNIEVQDASFFNKISQRIYGPVQNSELQFLQMGGFFSKKTHQEEDEKDNNLAAPLQFAS